MSRLSSLAATATRANISRIAFVIAGVMAIAWAFVVIPTFWSENVIIDVARAVIDGEAFKPEVLTAVEAPTETKRGSMLRSAVLGKAAVIRLRQAEDAIRAGDPKVIKLRLESLTQIVQDTLRNAPDDPFLWLVWFWLDTTRNGVRASNLPFLQMSYDLGPYEGWIAIKRSRVALADFQALTSALAERATIEFVDLVRWGLVPQAVDVAAATSPPNRRIVFARLADVALDQRRAFASALYAREVDDVPVPGIAPPTNQIPLPIMPPDFYSH
jgi:hypothetical protein